MRSSRRTSNKGAAALYVLAVAAIAIVAVFFYLNYKKSGIAEKEAQVAGEKAQGISRALNEVVSMNGWPLTLTDVNADKGYVRFTVSGEPPAEDLRAMGEALLKAYMNEDNMEYLTVQIYTAKKLAVQARYNHGEESVELF